MGILDRVKGFLDSWPKVAGQLEEVIRDGRMVELEGGLQVFEDIHTDTLQAPEGKISAACTPFEGDLEIQPD